LLDIDFAQVFIAFIVLLFSLTVHECAHAWTADRLGDGTARDLGRVSFNPVVHADLIGTVVFPLLALLGGVPLIGWAKPVPVNVRRLARPRRDYVLVAAAGPTSNLMLALGAAQLLRMVPVSPVKLGEPNV
jgi:Zn-dependent protease